MASVPPCLWRIPTMIVFLIFVSSCAFGDSSPVNAEGLELDLSSEELMAGRYGHHIHKRSAVTLPDNVTFTLTKEGDSENTVDIYLGKKVSFKLQILFPQATTDMLVELFAPDNESIVMMLCDVKIDTIGSNLNHDGAAQIVMDSQNQSNKYFDRAIIDFGNVSNTFVDQNAEIESCIVITWNAVMIDNDNTQDSTIYWVSAGAEYNYEMEVWVGQASFTTHLTGSDPDEGNYDAPTLNLTGPSSIEIGSSVVFTLDIFIDEPSVALSVDAFAPLNTSDVMSVVAMRVVDTGENYGCGFIPEEHVATLHREKNTRGYDRAHLDLGVVTNKGAREAGNLQHMNRITVEFVFVMYYDEAYVDQTYNVACAVEIGTSKIWTGFIGVTATAYVPDLNIGVSWQLTQEGSGKVSTVAALLMTLDITIPQQTTGRYALEVLAPFSDSAAVFQLCSLRLASKGSNLAGTDLNPVPSYTSRGDLIITDRIFLELGFLTNVGSWGWQPYNLTDPDALEPNTMRIQFLVKATNHSLATLGSSHGVTIGLVMDDTQLLVGTFNVEVEADPVLPNITAEMTPDWNLALLGGENVRIGGTGQFLFTMTTKRNTVYSPFDIEALTPNSSTGVPQVSLCQVQVISVGLNLPCFVAAAVNNSVTYTSSFDTALTSEKVFYDRGVVHVDSLCNQELENSTEADQVVFKVGFRVHADAGLTNGTKLWPSVGVMFSPYRMWVGQIRAWARDDIVNSGQSPHVAVLKVSTLVPLGYFARYNVLIKTGPGDIVTYSVNISVSTPGLSVCSIKVVEVGDNMPCTDATELEAVYERNAEGAIEEGFLDLGVVSNVASGAVSADGTVDDNTVVLEVLIGVSADAALVPDGSTHTFSLEVSHDSTGTPSIDTPSVPAFTVTHDQASITGGAVNVSDVDFTVVAITDTDNTSDVVLGQSKRLEMCAWTYPGTVTKLSFKMMTPVDTYGVMEVVHIGASYGGKNVPCAGLCAAGLVTYTSREGSSYSDIATIEMGHIINTNVDTVDNDANKVCVHGVFRVLRNESLAVGTVLQPAAALIVNDSEISVLPLSLTVLDNSTFTDIYLDNATLVSGTIITVNSTVPSPLCLTPGDFYTLPVVVTIPPFITSLVNMDVKLEVDTSACLTLHDVRIVSTGANLRGFGKEGDLQCTPNSTMGSSQMDTALCSFGYVTNPGMSHRCGHVGPEDDAMYLEVDLQMADCPKAVDGANLTASLGLKVVDYISILNMVIKVQRDGSEAPGYNITASANSTGDVMYIEYDVRLNESSQAEVHNASLIIMPPPYVTCSGTLESSSGTNGEPEVVSSSPPSSTLIINLGSIFFTDAIVLLVHCTTTPDYKVPSGINGHNTVVVHQLVGDVIPRVGMVTPAIVSSCLDYVNFTVTTVSETGVSCTSAALGVASASGVIFNCQISASDTSLSDAVNGRKGGSGWIPYVRVGELAGHRYFQVYFADKVQVDSIEIEQLNTAKATQIKLAYGNDGHCLVDGDTIDLSGASETVLVPNPRDSHVLRVYVTQTSPSDEKVSLTFEFHGCKTTSGGPSVETAVCDAVKKAVPPQTSGVTEIDDLFHRRTLVEVPGGVMYCDGVVENTGSCTSSNFKGVVNRCFFGDGAIWRPLDPRLAAMVGYDDETERAYALANNRVTFMSSEDQGLTWASTHSDVTSQARSKVTFKHAKKVPWTDRNGLPSPPHVDYQSGAWGATFDYLQKNQGSWIDKLKPDCC